MPDRQARDQLTALLREAPATVARDLGTYLTSTGCALIVVGVGVILVLGYVVYLVWLFGRQLL